MEVNQPSAYLKIRELYQTAYKEMRQHLQGPTTGIMGAPFPGVPIPYVMERTNFAIPRETQRQIDMMTGEMQMEVNLKKLRGM